MNTTVQVDTKLFYGLIVTGTSLLVAAHAFEQINDTQLRLALQRKGLDTHLRRLILEKLVPFTLESVEKALVERHRCRGCLRVEQARRSAVTLAFCLLRSGLPAELRQMVMEFAVDFGVEDSWGMSLSKNSRTIRAFAKVRKEEIFGGVGHAEHWQCLRWTDVFVRPRLRSSSVVRQCNICALDAIDSSFEFLYSPDRQQLIETFLSAAGVSMVSPKLDGPSDGEYGSLEYYYATRDVLAAVQIPIVPNPSLITTISSDYIPRSSVLQMTTASLATLQPTVPAATLHCLALFGVRSAGLSTPELQDQRMEMGTIGQAFAGSGLRGPAWTIWTRTEMMM